MQNPTLNHVGTLKSCMKTGCPFLYSFLRLQVSISCNSIKARAGLKTLHESNDRLTRVNR